MLNNRIPVEIVGPYVICFEAHEEWEDKRQHFVNECGWTEEQYQEIYDCPWFTAEVSIWKDGQVESSEYLGCCCYDKVSDFYTKDRSGYYSDMKQTLLANVQRQAA